MLALTQHRLWQVVDEARANVSRMLGADAGEIVFTSGGTESNNMVINTAIAHFQQLHPSAGGSDGDAGDGGGGGGKPHVVTSNLEHDSVALVLEHLQGLGAIDVTVVRAAPGTCAVAAADVAAAVTANTCLVTLMLANNETGWVGDGASCSVGDGCSSGNAARLASGCSDRLATMTCRP